RARRLGRRARRGVVIGPSLRVVFGGRRAVAAGGGGTQIDFTRPLPAPQAPTERRPPMPTPTERRPRVCARYDLGLGATSVHATRSRAMNAVSASAHVIACPTSQRSR